MNPYQKFVDAIRHVANQMNGLAWSIECSAKLTPNLRRLAIERAFDERSITTGDVDKLNGLLEDLKQHMMTEEGQ